MQRTSGRDDILLLFACFVFFATLLVTRSVFAQEEKREITGFLQTNFGIKYEPSFFQRLSWNCPPTRMVKPSGNTTRNWVCERRDPRLNRLIVWRILSDDSSGIVERDNFNTMAGGKDAQRGEPQCKSGPLWIGDGKISGMINDCMLPLPNGQFYASFFHFTHRDLGFTFLVKNASPSGSTAKVAEDLREWLGELAFEE